MSTVDRHARPHAATLSTQASSPVRGLMLRTMLGLILGLTVYGASVAQPGDVAPAQANPPADPPRCPATLVGPQARSVQAPDVDITWRAVPDPIAVGKPFAVEFEVCLRGDLREAARVSVDALMPEHRHGMNYRPSISGVPGGVMRAEGLVFHMPGRWQLVFDVQSGAQKRRLTQDLAVR